MRMLAPCPDVRRLGILTGIAVGPPAVPGDPLRIAVRVNGIRPRVRRPHRKRQRLASPLVVHRHQVGQQIDRRV